MNNRDIDLIAGIITDDPDIFDVESLEEARRISRSDFDNSRNDPLFNKPLETLGLVPQDILLLNDHNITTVGQLAEAPDETIAEITRLHGGAEQDFRNELAAYIRKSGITHTWDLVAPQFRDNPKARAYFEQQVEKFMRKLK